jgi:steroid delta-isomerase-like uncharacterized protein
MTSDEIRALLTRFATAWREEDLETLSECYTDDCEVVSPIFHTLRGRAQVEGSFRDLFKSFSNVSFQTEQPIIDAEHGRAAMVWTLKGKHAGEIFGVSPTGRTIEVNTAFVMTFNNGRILKEVRIYDFAKMLLELGVLRARA